MTKRGAQAIAYDYSAAALQFAQHNADNRGAAIVGVQGDVFRLPFESNVFEAVFHAGVLEHFRHPKDVLSEQKRVLKPGGILLVDVPQTYNLYTLYKARRIRSNTWFAGWETQFCVRQLESLLRSLGLEIIDRYGYGYYPPLLEKVRWASSIGRGFMGRALMPSGLANIYEGAWQRFERTRVFLYCAQWALVIVWAAKNADARTSTDQCTEFETNSGN